MSRTFQQVTLAGLYLTAPRCPGSTRTAAERSYRTLGLANSVINGKTDGAKRHSGTQIHRKSFLLLMQLTKRLYFMAIFSEALCSWQAEHLDLSLCPFFASLFPQCRQQYLAERYSNREEKKSRYLNDRTEYSWGTSISHFCLFPPKSINLGQRMKWEAEKSQCTTSESVLGHVRKKFFCFRRAAGSPERWAAHALLCSETRHVHTRGRALHSCTLGAQCEGLGQLIRCNGARFPVSVQTFVAHLAELINCQRAARQTSSFWETGESSSSWPLVMGKMSLFVQQIRIVGFLTCLLMK